MEDSHHYDVPKTIEIESTHYRVCSMEEYNNELTFDDVQGTNKKVKVDQLVKDVARNFPMWRRRPASKES